MYYYNLAKKHIEDYKLFHFHAENKWVFYKAKDNGSSFDFKCSEII